MADDWRDDAACAGMDTDLFFNDTPGVIGKRDIRRVTCNSCPVRRDCLTSALNEERGHAFVIGWRGGKSARERWRILHPRPGQLVSV